MLKGYLFVIVILSTIVRINLYATENTFGKTIGGIKYGMSISPTSDSGMIISGTSVNSDSIVIVKTDKEGNIQWRKYFKGFEFSILSNFDNYHSDIEQTKNGNYIFINTIEGVGAAVQVHKLTAQGVVEWSKVYDNEGDDLSREVLSTKDNGFLFLYHNSSVAYMIKSDSLGNEQWAQTEVLSGFSNYDFQIRQTKDLGYIFGRKTSLIKYNTLGKEVWRIGYNNVLRDKVEELYSGGFIIMDHKGNLERTDALGDILWQKKKLSRLGDFTIDVNDNIIIVGEQLVKLDINAKILWEKSLPFGDIRDIYTEQDGSIILVGLLQNREGFAARYSADGEAEYIILRKPEGGEALQIDSKYNIEWVSSGFGEMKIEWTNENQDDWIILEQIQDSLAQYEWNTPGYPSISNTIRVSSLSNPAISDENKTDFRVGAKHYDYIAINEIFMYFATDGSGSHDEQNSSSGFFWPGGINATQTAVFQDGPLWGGLVNGDTLVHGSTHRQGLQPGNIMSNGAAADPNSAEVGVYKARPDWQILSDSPLKQRFEYDWNNWPVHLGAPWIDVDGDGSYNPQVDHPDISGDEMNWMVMNDLDSVKTKRLYGAYPIGIEVQLAIYGYNTTNDLKDVIFKRYKHFNKSSYRVDSLYFSYWADVDLGDASDDYVGTDTLLNMVYSYNGDDNDAVYSGVPPAIGYVLLQGPVVVGEPEDSAFAFNKWHLGNRNLKMSSSNIYINGAPPPYDDPQRGSIQGSRQYWNNMRGRAGGGEHYFDPTTGKPTAYMFTGDPVSKTGWYESEHWGSYPDDRRQLMSSGPVKFAPGDSQEVVYAIVIARGDNRLDSITKLKEKAVAVKEFYYTGKLPTAIKDDEPVLSPNKFSLSQNYPNPFNPETIINYELPRTGKVKLIIYDVLGRKVKTLVNKTQPAGKYKVVFNAANLASGVYYYKLKAGKDFETTRKMLLLR
jgi:type IX secretion system substrate protein